MPVEGEGVKKSQNVADVIIGCSLTKDAKLKDVAVVLVGRGGALSTQKRSSKVGEDVTQVPQFNLKGGIPAKEHQEPFANQSEFPLDPSAVSTWSFAATTLISRQLPNPLLIWGRLHSGKLARG